MEIKKRFPRLGITPVCTCVCVYKLFNSHAQTARLGTTTCRPYKCLFRLTFAVKELAVEVYDYIFSPKKELCKLCRFQFKTVTVLHV